MSENVSIVPHKPFQATGVTSSAAKGCFGISVGAGIKIYNTVSGASQATVYSSCSPITDCMTDVAAGNFTSGVAKWDKWGAGDITTATTTSAVQSATMAVSCAAISVTSGTWTFEVTL